MSTNGARLDRIEKATGSGDGRGPGTVYQEIAQRLTQSHTRVRGNPNYVLEHQGKIIVNDDEIRWAGKRKCNNCCPPDRAEDDHPDARYPEHVVEINLADINQLSIDGKFTEEEIRRTFDLIMDEAKAGTPPEVKW